VFEHGLNYTKETFKIRNRAMEGMIQGHFLFSMLQDRFFFIFKF